MREKIGSLECLVRPGDQERYAVFLHGFGADAGDLFPLANVLDPDEDWTFVFPQAPLEVPIGPSWTGRAWFPISLRDLEAGVDFTQIRPPGLDASSAAVKDLLFELNCPKVVLGGFSQGAMVATEVAMSDPESIAGLVIYSGVLLDQSGWTKRAPSLAGKPILQSHGSFDQVLSIQPAQRLFELLKGAGAKVSFHGFQGAHEIPNAVLAKTHEFLKTLE